MAYFTLGACNFECIFLREQPFLPRMGGCSCALTWSMHLIIFVNNAMRQAHGFALIITVTCLLLLMIQNHVLVSWHC